MFPFKTFKSVPKKEFFEVAERVERETKVKWLKDHSKHMNFYKVELEGKNISQLYLYHGLSPGDKTKSKMLYQGIYQPLGISKKDYLSKYYTFAEIVPLLLKNKESILATSWHLDVQKWMKTKNLNFVRYPLFLNEVASGKFEVIDANHRLLAKILQAGYNFECVGYVMTKNTFG